MLGCISEQAVSYLCFEMSHEGILKTHWIAITTCLSGFWGLKERITEEKMDIMAGLKPVGSEREIHKN